MELAFAVEFLTFVEMHFREYSIAIDDSPANRRCAPTPTWKHRTALRYGASEPGPVIS
jgi:hypothetical protein